MIKKIIIKQDTSCEMLSISTEDGTCLFYGNAWDFNISGENFKYLFEKIGLETEIVDVNMSDG